MSYTLIICISPWRNHVSDDISDNTLYPCFYSAYSGATDTAVDYASDSNWAAPVTILQKDLGDTPLGKIIAIGEPTIANDNGVETLYFVYGYVRAIDPITGIADVNLQAGFIQKK